MSFLLKGFRFAKTFVTKAKFVNGLCFSAVGVFACLFVSNRALEATKSSHADELSSIARLAAQQIDPVAHDALKSPSDAKLDSYWQQIDRLAQVFSATANVSAIYTVRRSKSGFIYVLDTTPVGDANHDGMEDRSPFLDKVLRDPSAMSEAYRNGMGSVELRPIGSRRGVAISAFAPIRDAQGQIVGLVGVDRPYSYLKEELDHTNSITLVGCIVVTILAFLVSLATSRPDYNAAHSSQTAEVRRFRRRLLISGLVIGVSIVVVESTYAGLSGAAIDKSLDRERAGWEVLRRTEWTLEQVVLGTPNWEREAGQLGKLLVQQKKAWLIHALDKIKDTDPARAAEIARPVLVRLNNETANTEEEIARLQSSQREAVQRYARISIVALVLAIGCIVVLRVTSGQDERLVEAVEESNQVQNDYGNLVEAMPISLFAYARGAGLFSNRTWQEFFDAKPGENQIEAFVARVHPADRWRVQQELEGAERSQTSTTFDCRVVGSKGKNQVVETRVAPVTGPDGAFRHMLSFCLDMTQQRKAEQELRTMNAEVTQKNALLSRALAELEDNLGEVVRAMVRAIEAKDIYTAGHSERVMQYGVWVGEEMGLGPYELRILEMGLLVHDIGKIGIPDAVLTKPARLTNEEFDIIKLHPVLGANIMGGIKPFEECIPIIRGHHEKLDGSGYPDGLKGDEISVSVRIATVADIFDAMTSSRAYRKKIETQEVLDIMLSEVMEGKIDPAALNALIKVVERHGVIPQRQDGLAEAA
ncbi:MAG: HD domain-containing protein [Fimbriimonadaceae bacterium]|nr:HD domain-containing protein [Fimbriimonadaceae bacterium]QYK55931.1 MAG: HD domain-containing protein [Fimbriimonadaceae bacterium]